MQQLGLVVFLIGVAIMVGTMVVMGSIWAMPMSLAITAAVVLGGPIAFIGAFIVERTTYVDMLPDYVKKESDRGSPPPLS